MYTRGVRSLATQCTQYIHLHTSSCNQNEVIRQRTNPIPYPNYTCELLRAIERKFLFMGLRCLSLSSPFVEGVCLLTASLCFELKFSLKRRRIKPELGGELNAAPRQRSRRVDESKFDNAVWGIDKPPIDQYLINIKTNVYNTVLI